MFLACVLEFVLSFRFQSLTDMSSLVSGFFPRDGLFGTWTSVFNTVASISKESGSF